MKWRLSLTSRVASFSFRCSLVAFHLSEKPTLTDPSPFGSATSTLSSSFLRARTPILVQIWQKCRSPFSATAIVERIPSFSIF
ncbi:hypothetical protein SDJN03_11457, partial [Cucurbita argyrosperma subsp. sororia]